MQFRAAVMLVLVGVAIAASAGAEEVVLSPRKDNTIYASPDLNLSNGAGQHFMAGRNNQGGVEESLRRGLIAFDLGVIPGCSTIESATLTLFLDRTPDSVPREVSLHRLSMDWGEGTSNAGSIGTGGGGGLGVLATEGDATSLYRFYHAADPESSPKWTAANADGDYDPIASAVAVVGTGPPVDQAIDYSWTGAGMLDDVRYWLDHPDMNFGWLVKTDESVEGTARRFESRENINNGSGGRPDYRPRLTIRYTPAWSPADFDRDGDVDRDDADLLATCGSGPSIPFAVGCEDRDLDEDGDVDQHDFGSFQRCVTGPNGRAGCDCPSLPADSGER